MYEDAPDVGESESAPSRAKRAFSWAKIALTLIAPVIGLTVLMLLLQTSGDASQVREVAPSSTPIATAAPTPVPTMPQVGFTNHWFR